MPKNPSITLIRIINRGTRWVAFGEYQCGVEYIVTPDVAAHLALRGFVPVDDATTSPAISAPITANTEE